MKKFIKSFLITLGVVVFVLGAGFGITYAIDKDFALDLLDKIGIQIEQPVEQPDDETPGGDIEVPGEDIEVPGEDTGETEEPENPDDTEDTGETETYICNVSDYEFDGNTITAYNGDDKYIQIPSSYSISGTETVDMTFFDELEFTDYLMLNFEDITYPITITDANSKQYILNSEMDVFENQDIVYPVSLEVEKTIYVEGDDYQVNFIGEEAFAHNENLECVKISNSVTGIDRMAFSYCSSLTNVIFEDNSQLASIEGWAFSSCSSLTSMNIPNSVTNIGDYAFTTCSALETITVENGNSIYHSAENCIIETASKTLVVGCKNSIIPNDGSVTSIGEAAFHYNKSLGSITIPDDVISIEASAFAGCSNLTSVSFEDNSQLTSIGAAAFEFCSSLIGFTIPDSVTSIGVTAFHLCSGLTGSITIPEGVTNIGVSAFNGFGITDVIYLGQTPNIQLSTFANCNSVMSYDFRNCITVPTLASVSSLEHADGCKIIIPDALYDEWTTATNWSSLTNVVWIKASEATNA